MIRFFDISVTVSDDMVIWPGLVPTRLTSHESMENGDPVNVTNFSACSHVGTHVDAPKHHYADGSTIDEVPVDRYIGKARVVDLTRVEWEITARDLEVALQGQHDCPILVMKTRNSTELPTWQRFDEKYVHIGPDAARYIADNGYRTVVFDHLAVEGYNREGAPTHKILLGESDVSIVEGVYLGSVAPGVYLFMGAPVKLRGSDGSPTRAVLIHDDTGAIYNGW